MSTWELLCLGVLVTSEFLAQEILRSAVGTIGLVASVPITTALAALVADLPAPHAAASSRRHAAPPGRNAASHLTRQLG
jgi:hypothetical protein